MEPGGSLPHSQVPATCPYPEPDNLVHTPTSHVLKIYFNIILPSTPGSPKWYFSLRFPHQNPAYATPLPHTRYMPRSSHSSWFHHRNNIGWAVQIIKLPMLLCQLGLICYKVKFGLLGTAKFTFRQWEYFNIRKEGSFVGQTEYPTANAGILSGTSESGEHVALWTCKKSWYLTTKFITPN